VWIRDSQSATAEGFSIGRSAMKRSVNVALAAGLFTVSLLAGRGLNAQAPAQDKTAPAGKASAAAALKWEYKIVFGGSDEAELDKLGEEGWELVATASRVSGGGTRNGTGGGVHSTVQFIFKRPKR
jgi:hypothetical protein